MNMHHHRPNVVSDQDVASAYLTGIRSLKTPGPGAVAHMSLHQKLTMSKSRSTISKRTAKGSPICTGGSGYPFVLATEAVKSGEAVCSASVEPI